MSRFILAIIFLIVFLAGCATPGYIPPPRPPKRLTGVYHQVRDGETVFRIAKAYNIDMDQIVKVNRISDADRIDVGQRLFIPGVRLSRTITPEMKGYENFIWPVKGEVIFVYGAKKGRITNKGIDIQAKEGETVVAARSGWVKFCGDRVKGYGGLIIIDHGDGYQTTYAYNSVNLVRQGEYVSKDSPIAKVGSTGRAKGPSLHFEIRKDHKPCNPFHYLP